MEVSLEQRIEELKNQVRKIEEELDGILKQIIDADAKKGIEYSCQVQDQFGPKLDCLLDDKKTNEEQLKELYSQIVNNINAEVTSK